MKQISLLKIYELGLLAVIFLIVLHAPISVAVGHFLPDLSLVVKAWKEVLLAILAVITIVLVAKQKLWHKVLGNPFIALALFFIDIHLILAVVMQGDTRSVAAGLMIDLRFIVMFMLMYVLVLLNPDVIRRVLKMIAAGAAVVLGFGMLQILVLPDDVLGSIGYSRDTIMPFLTVDTNPDYVRINSTLRGPNPVGALMVVYGSLAFAYLLINRRKISSNQLIVVVAGLLSAAAVLFASYSRSAYLAAIAAVGVVFVATSRISRGVVLSVLGLGVTAAIAGVLLVQTSWFSNVILHENPESTVEAKSNSDHLSSLLNGGQRVLAQPLGAGVGSTGSASLYDGDSANDTVIENTYLFIAHESGWFGLAIFLGLFGLIIVRLWQRRKGNWLVIGVLGGGVGLAVIGLLLPVWVDDTIAIIWWGLAGMAIASISGIIEGGNATETRKQKTTRAA